MSELKVESRDVGDVSVLYPRGFVNAHTVRAFESALQELLTRRRFRVVLNCADLVYIASAGLGAMMGSIEEIRANGGDLRVCSLNETVRNIFEILGFHHLYRTFGSEGEAVESFRAAAEAGS